MAIQRVFTGLRVPFGERDGKMWAPEEVPGGKKCGCRCPDPRCGAQLISKYMKRTQRHFFAHFDAPECPGGVESALHKMGKQIIQEAGVVTLPAPEFSHRDLEGAEAYCPETETLSLSNVQTEKAAGIWVPDVTAQTPEGEPLYIEILVTHAVEEGKAESLDNLMEINLSEISREQIQDAERFREFVLHSAPRRWYRVSRYHAGIDAEMQARHGEALAVIRAMQEPANVRKHSADLARGEAYAKAKETVRCKGQEPAYKGVERPGRYVDVELDHDWVLGAHRLAWQSYLLLDYFLAQPQRTIIRPHDALRKVEQYFGVHPAAKALEALTPFERRWMAIDPMLTKHVTTHVIEEYMIHLAGTGSGMERRRAVFNIGLGQGNYFVLANRSIGESGVQGAGYNADIKKASRPKYPEPGNRLQRPIPADLIPFVKAGKQYVSICRRCKYMVGSPVKKCDACHGTAMDLQFIGNLRFPNS